LARLEVTNCISPGQGRKVALFGLGNMQRIASQAAAQLATEGFDAR